MLSRRPRPLSAALQKHISPTDGLLLSLFSGQLQDCSGQDDSATPLPAQHPHLTTPDTSAARTGTGQGTLAPAEPCMDTMSPMLQAGPKPYTKTHHALKDRKACRQLCPAAVASSAVDQQGRGHASVRRRCCSQGNCSSGASAMCAMPDQQSAVLLLMRQSARCTLPCTFIAALLSSNAMCTLSFPCSVFGATQRPATHTSCNNTPPAQATRDLACSHAEQRSLKWMHLEVCSHYSAQPTTHKQ